MVVHGVQLLKRGDISVCSQDTGLLDEKKKMITTGEKKRKVRPKTWTRRHTFKKVQTVMSNYIFVHLG